jgi:hypothetical protein
MMIILKPMGAIAVLSVVAVLTLSVLALSRSKAPTLKSTVVATKSSLVTTKSEPTSVVLGTASQKTDWQAIAGTKLDSMLVASPESENQHKIRGKNTVAALSVIDPLAKYRDARDGGWFSFDMKVHPRKPNLLVLRYWGDENNLRVFDILVDGNKIAQEKLLHNIGPKYYEVGYKIPINLTTKKSKIEVKLSSNAEGTNGWSGGIFFAKTYEIK